MAIISSFGILFPFMYANSAEEMVKPLDKMFRGQEGINWMGK